MVDGARGYWRFLVQTGPLNDSSRNTKAVMMEANGELKRLRPPVRRVVRSISNTRTLKKQTSKLAIKKVSSAAAHKKKVKDP